MSVHISSYVWKTEFDNPTRKLVALALADMASDEGVCWPSVRSICERCGVSDSTAREHIRALQDSGFLEKQERQAQGGRQTSNLFKILPPPCQSLPPSQPVGTPPTGQLSPPPTGQPAPLNHHKEPSTEPSKETTMAAGSGLLFDATVEPDFPAGSMMKSWNTRCPSLTKINGIVGKRAKSARARYKDLGGTMADWDAFCDRIERADKLTGRYTGRSSSQWIASFDWCIEPANFLKITEGKYDPSKPTPTHDIGW